MSFTEELNSGIVKVRAGKLNEAMPHYEAALALAKGLDETFWAMGYRGSLYRHMGEKAQELLNQALDIKERRDDTRGQWFVLDSIAVLAARSGNPELAKQLFPHTINPPNAIPLPYHKTWRDEAMESIGLTPTSETAVLEEAKGIARRILSAPLAGRSGPQAGPREDGSQPPPSPV